MTKQRTFFAVDLGATSGRTILGTLADGQLQMEELTRFGNPLIEVCGHFYWDIFALYNEMIGGLKLVAQRGIGIESIGIDTWGVDFVCIGRDGGLLRNPLAYRDPHTFQAMDDYFNHVLDREKVYGITGIQFMNFNSLFQLYAMQQAGNCMPCVAKAMLPSSRQKRYCSCPTRWPICSRARPFVSIPLPLHHRCSTLARRTSRQSCWHRWDSAERSSVGW